MMTPSRGGSWVEPAFESRYPTRRSELVGGRIAVVDGESFGAGS